MSNPVIRGALAAAVAFTLTACARAPEGAVPVGSTSARVSEGEVQSLQNLGAWRGYRSQEVPTGWSDVDGVITKTGNADDLVSRAQYGNFEFSLEWKIAPRGNSGIFYRATEEYEKIYWSATEYQLLDDAAAPDGRNRLTSAAAAYGFHGPPPGVVKPAGEWNSTRIVATGNHVEHWLNGQKVVEYDYGSPDWEAKLAASKFAAWPNYGRAKRGHLGIQGDHNGLLSLRNMQVRELP